MASLTMDNPLGGEGSSLSPSPQIQLNKNTRDMQECIADMKQEFEDHRIPITDDSKTLQRFCAKLEFLLQFGMKSKTSLLGGKKDYWDYISDCLSANKGSSDGIKFVKSISDLKTSLGRGRAFLRFCLMHQRLADTLQQCVYNSKVTNNWYLPKSVWAQPALTGAIITSLYDLNDLQFDLSPRGYDLDTAWPTFARKQFGAGVSLGSWAPPTRSSSISSLSSIPNTSLDISGIFPSPSFNSSTISEAEADHVREELNQSENEKIRLQAQLEIGDARNNTMEQEMSELKGKVEELQREKNEFQVECEKLKNELKLKDDAWAERQTFYNGKIDEATRAVCNMKDKLDRQNALVNTSTAAAANFDMIEAKGQLTVMQRKNTALQIELKAVEMELRSKTLLEEQKSKLINLLDRKLNQVNKRNNELSEKIDVLKTEGANAKPDEKATESTGAGETIKDYQAKVQDLTDRLEYSETVNAQLKHSNTELRKMLGELEGKGVKLMDLAKEKIKKYSDENKQLKSDSEGLTKQVTDGDGKVQEVRDLLLAAEKEKEEITQEKRHLELKLDTLADSIVNKEETNIEIMNEVLKIRESMAQAEEERMNKQYKGRLDILENENRALADNLIRTKEELDRVSGQKRVLDEQMKNLKAVLNPLGVTGLNPLDGTDGGKEEVDAHEVQAMVIEALQERQQYQTEARASEAHNSELRCKIETDQYTINGQSEDLRCAQLELAELKIRISRSEIGKADVDTKVEHMEEMLKNREKDDEEKLEDLKNKEAQLVELENKNADVETLVNEKEDVIKELRERLESTSSEFSQAMESTEALVKEKEEIEEENKKLIVELEELHVKFSGLESSLKVVEVEKEGLEEDRKVLSEKVESLERDKERICGQLKEMEDSFGQSVEEKLVLLKDKIQDERTAKENLEKEIADVKKQSEESETLLKEILEKKDEDERKQENEIKDMNGKIEEFERSILEKETEIEKNKTELSELTAKITTLETAEEKLKTDYSKLSGQFEEGCARLREVLGTLKSREDGMTSLRGELEGVRTEKQTAEVQIQNLTIEVDKLKEKIGEKENEVESLGKELGEKKNVIEEYNNKFTDKENIMAALEKELAELKENRNDLKQNLVVLEREKSLVSENLNQSQSEMQTKLETFSKDSEDLKAKLEKSTKLKTDLETELSNANKARDDLEVELEELKNEMQSLKTATENMKTQLFEKEREIEKSRSEVEVIRSEVSRSDKVTEEVKASLEQELSALRFQLSSEQMQYQDMLKGYKTQQSGVVEMSDKLAHQSSVIDSLEAELNLMKDERKIERQRQQEELEEYKQNYAEKNEQCNMMNTQLKRTIGLLDEERNLVLKYKNESRSLTVSKEEQLKKLEAELALTQHDNQEMMKHLVKLCKDKDELWQKTDRLQYIQKLMAAGKWMDDSGVKKCMSCSAEFSWMLRKHHCRVCGRIFCYSCCDHWMMTPHSSKKARVCNDCFMAQSLTEEEKEQLSASDSGEDQQQQQHLDTGQSGEDEDDVAVLETTTESKPEPAPHIPGITDIPTPPPSRTSAPGAPPGAHGGAITTNPYEYNVTDEEKEHKMFYVGSYESTDIRLSGDEGTDEGPMEEVPLGDNGDPAAEGAGRPVVEEAFDLITDEEIVQSMHQSMIEPSLHDPNLLSCPTLTVDAIARGEVPHDPDLWVKAGKNFAVPVNIDSPGVVLSWEFLTEPKGIHFSVSFRENMYVEESMVEELIPRTACNSHKQAVQGELFARKAGLYTLLFDNSTSRFTSKRLEYKLQVRKPEVANSSPMKTLH